MLGLILLDGLERDAQVGADRPWRLPVSQILPREALAFVGGVPVARNKTREKAESHGFLVVPEHRPALAWSSQASAPHAPEDAMALCSELRNMSVFAFPTTHSLHPRNPDSPPSAISSARPLNPLLPNSLAGPCPGGTPRKKTNFSSLRLVGTLSGAILPFHDPNTNDESTL